MGKEEYKEGREVEGRKNDRQRHTGPGRDVEGRRTRERWSERVHTDG